MAKCEYEFSFKIKCDEPINELRIKLVDKKGSKISSVAVPVKEEKEEIETGDDISDEIPPEMNAVF